MNILNRSQLNLKKNSNVLVVYGCGNSINDLNNDDIKNLSQYDSIAFNWFCKSKLPTTYYLVREQANIPSRISKGETIKDFYKEIQAYKDSCFFVHNVHHHSPHAFPHHKHTDKLPGSGVIVKDLKKGFAADWVSTDILKQGVYHGKCTLNNVLHIGFDLNYEVFLFVGFDLYDSRYFWLKNEPRHTLDKKNKKIKDKHPVGRHVLDLVSDVKKTWGLTMFTFNPKSLLKKVIPVWNNEDFMHYG